ncbi:YhfC family intramembrane metalloprotease [Clostridium sp. UBA6640]|uniref:YhfC family intramembrane metalloprotease n=1 Tax=Clostridium sp. UBA6640 TaxID=1946370 RepID=UPI0025C004D5|nr:YhfC family intramembrane metalloprotease [Clostridium sp. UBA6640]
MVNSASIISAGISGAMCFLFPIIILIYFKKKEKINLKPVIIGAIVFFIFTQILERLLHMVVIGNNLIKNPILFSIYGALAAGIFEEVGRFIAFKTVLKNNHEWKDGIAFGIGHGGIEAIIIGVVSNVQFIIYSNLINIQTSASNFIISFTERIFAFGIQIALTMIVLYAIKYRKNIYLFIAILIHAVIDFPAALYQMKIINLFIAESIIFLFFIISLIYLGKTKKIFTDQVI